jgi:hypothetical protein
MTSLSHIHSYYTHGLFYILKEFKNSDVKSAVCGKAVWQVPQPMCDILIQLEVELMQIASILKQSIPYYGPHHQEVPAPMSQKSMQKVPSKGLEMLSSVPWHG